jgi:Do/DeqQ family serine protease
MKKTIKIALGMVAVIAVSAVVAGVTTYTFLRPGEGKEATFNETFKTISPTYAGLSSSSVQPVDLTTAAETTVNSVVHIMAIQRSKVQTVQVQPDFFDFFFGNPRGRERQVETPEERGFGSGVIISKDGYIVTNNHVVEDADEISVKLHDGRELKGRVIGTDPTTDLALVKIEGDDFPAIPIGDSEALKVGEWVLAVGNPFNLGSTVTAGIVSAKARNINILGDGSTIESFIQTDAAINPGNSGGALVDIDGNLIGINAMLYSPTGTYSGYGFAIPTSIMTKVVTDLKKYGTVQRAVLGIEGRDMGKEVYPDEIRKEQKELGVNEGVQVVNVLEGGSSYNVLQKNDVILKLDGKDVKTMAELQGLLVKYRPGDKVSVTVWRDKKEKNFTITLKNTQGTTKVVKNADMELLGAAFREVSDDLKEQLNLGYGLQVTAIEDGRIADSGIRKGFIILKANGKQMHSVQDLENAMKTASQSPDQVLFMTGVYPSGKQGYYAVNLSQE